jgi:hypothetical protein
MKVRLLGIAFLSLCLFQAKGNLWAQPFDAPPTPGPGPASDSTYSLGSFSIVLNPSVSGAFVGNPYYSASTNTFTSPVLSDPNTQINRSSGTLNLGGGPVSKPVGSPTGPLVTSNSGDSVLNFSGNLSPNTSGVTYPVPAANQATPSLSNGVFTQIKSFDLTNGVMSVLTGTAANDPNLPASVGQVTSNSTTGGFPARSFFDVFVDIEIPLPPSLGGGTATLTNATVYGGSGGTVQQSPATGMPLLITNTGITTFPPVVIYVHGGSSAQPVYLESTNNVGLQPLIGDPLGLLVLAGHGAGYGSTSGTSQAVDENTGQPANQSTFQQAYNTMLSTPSDYAPIPPQYASWAGPDYPGTIAEPEPSTFALLGAGVSCLGAYMWRRRQTRRQSGRTA